MNSIENAPPIITPRRVLTYELTRGDLFTNWLTIFFRNRIIQIVLLVAFFLNAGLILGPGVNTRPLSHLIFGFVGYAVLFVGVLLVVQGLMGFATAFLLPQRGLVGQHTLEVREEGLVERTAYNETLHRWPSICRVISLFGYLYIYVGDNNSHQVPKRRFSPRELDEFVADIRARATQLR